MLPWPWSWRVKDKKQIETTDSTALGSIHLLRNVSVHSALTHSLTHSPLICCVDTTGHLPGISFSLRSWTLSYPVSFHGGTGLDALFLCSQSGQHTGGHLVSGHKISGLSVHCIMDLTVIQTCLLPSTPKTEHLPANLLWPMSVLGNIQYGSPLGLQGCGWYGNDAISTRFWRYFWTQTFLDHFFIHSSIDHYIFSVY